MYDTKTVDQDLTMNCEAFLESAIEHFLAAHEPSGRRHWQFAILHLAQSLELAAKAILHKMHPVLIYEKLDDGRSLKTVNLEVALGRLQRPEIAGLRLTTQQTIAMTNIKDIRNRIVHAGYRLDPDMAHNYFVEALALVEWLLSQHLKISTFQILNQDKLRKVRLLSDKIVRVDISPTGDASGAVATTSIEWGIGNVIYRGILTNTVPSDSCALLLHTSFQHLNTTFGPHTPFNVQHYDKSAPGATIEMWTLLVQADLIAQWKSRQSGNLSLKSGSESNSLHIWAQTCRSENNLAGTGFNRGTLVLQARITEVTNELTLRSDSMVSAFDQCDSNNYPLTTSISAGGSLFLIATVEFINDAFLRPSDDLHNVLTESALKVFLIAPELVAPFLDIDPSLRFMAPTNSCISNIGSVNGLSGPDVQMQVGGYGNGPVMLFRREDKGR